MAVTLRSTKGSPLSHSEMDDNFTEINILRRITVDNVTAGGTADALTADFTNNVTLAEGLMVCVEAAAANTGAATLAVDGGAAKSIVKEDGDALIAGDIIGAGHYMLLKFDNTADNWILLNPGIATKAGDADTLDGVEGSNYARTDIEEVFSNSIGIGGATPGGTFDNGNAIALGDSDTGIRQNTDGELELWSNNQEIVNINTTAVNIVTGELRDGGNRVLTVADEGSGNGLDADTLDGNHASAFLGASAKAADSELLDGINSTSFLRSDAADIKTSGNLRFNDNVDLSFGTGNDYEISFTGTTLIIDAQVSNANDIQIRNTGNNAEFLFDISTGDFHADGNVVAVSTTTPSDPRLKENINKIDGALEKITKLNGVTFSWKKDKEGNQNSAGLISTDVREVLPEAVTVYKDMNSDEEYDHVNYNAIIGLLVESVKELKQEVETLKNDSSN